MFAAYSYNMNIEKSSYFYRADECMVFARSLQEFRSSRPYYVCTCKQKNHCKQKNGPFEIYPTF